MIRAGLPRLLVCMVLFGSGSSAQGYFEDFENPVGDEQGTLTGVASVSGGQLHGEGAGDLFILDGNHVTAEAVVRFRPNGASATWDEVAYTFGGDGTTGGYNGTIPGLIASWLPVQGWLYVKHSSQGPAVWATVFLDQSAGVLPQGYNPSAQYDMHVVDKGSTMDLWVEQVGVPTNRVEAMDIDISGAVQFGARSALYLVEFPYRGGVLGIEQVTLTAPVAVVLTESGGQSLVQDNITGASTDVSEANPAYAEDTYLVVLSTQPSGDVTVTADPVDMQIELDDAGAGNPVALLFTTATWNIPQTVTVRAVPDAAQMEGVEVAVIEHTAAGAAEYSGIAIADLNVNVADPVNQKYGDFEFVVFAQNSPFILDKVTHIVPRGVSFAADGTITPEPWLPEYVEKAHAYGVKVMMNVGNEGNTPHDYERFNEVVDNADGSRDNFVNNLLAYVQNHNLDGMNFDIEWSEQIPPWLNYNLCLVETRAAFGNAYEIHCNVYGTRHEIKSNGFAAIDAVEIMSYGNFGEMTSFIGLQKSYGASDNQIRGGMASSWNEFGIDPALAAQKTQYCLDNGYGGMFSFGFDTEDPATSMILGVSQTLVSHYDANVCQISSTSDLDGDRQVALKDFALFTGLWDSGSVILEDFNDFVSGWLYELSLTTHLEFNASGGSIAADSSDCSCDGELMNMDGFDWVAGKTGNALDFDGVNDYVELPCFVSLTGSVPRTVAAWIKTDTTGEIVGWGSAQTSEGWLVYLNPSAGSGVVGALRVAVWGGTLVGSADLRDNQWHHVAVVLPDGSSQTSELKLYVDGQEEIISGNVSGPIDTDSEHIITIGVFRDLSRSTFDYFDGQIDDFRIYTRGLSDLEIQALAN